MSRRKQKKRQKSSSPKTNGAASTVVDLDDVEQTDPGADAAAVDEDTAEVEVEAEADEETGLEAAGPVEEASTTDELAQELETVRDFARRKQAEFENFRKRIERERAETVKYAASGLMGEILPVLDNLERAIEASKAGSEDNFREGVEIIYRQFREILFKQGLEELDARNAEFDPHVHEAVGRVETTDHPDGTVLEVFLKGYRFKDKLLRPAMVNVAISADEGNEASDDDTEQSDEEQDT